MALMHTLHISPDLASLERIEKKMQREAYERAGLEARALGVPRQKNPFVRTGGSPFFDPAEGERMQALAEHWWRGWDAGREKAERPRSQAARTERARP